MYIHKPLSLGTNIYDCENTFPGMIKISHSFSDPSSLNMTMNNTALQCLDANPSPSFGVADAIATIIALLSLAVGIFGSYFDYKSYKVTRQRKQGIRPFLSLLNNCCNGSELTKVSTHPVYTSYGLPQRHSCCSE